MLVLRALLILSILHGQQQVTAMRNNKNIQLQQQHILMQASSQPSSSPDLNPYSAVELPAPAEHETIYKGHWARNILDPALDEFLNSQVKSSHIKLLSNISPAGTVKGVVVASPSKSHPDYWYHWVRDAALVMKTVVTLYEEAIKKNHTTLANEYENRLWAYANFERENQLKVTKSGNLGEPKFNVDGTPFDGDWGRPQHDGPALRALTLIRFAELFLDVRNGSMTIVKEKLYRSEYPAHSVIKSDLEHTAKFWESPSIELWEEVRGFSIHTRAVQRAALNAGAKFALRMGDPYASDFYKIQETRISTVINKEHISDHAPHYILSTIGWISGPRVNKTLNMDVSAVLAALQVDDTISDIHDILSLESGYVLSTAINLAWRMKKLYPINANDAHVSSNLFKVAPGIGRYPEDVYDGYSTESEGNPWFLATNAFAELCYKLANRWLTSGEILITPILFNTLNMLVKGGMIDILSPTTHFPSTSLHILPIKVGKIFKRQEFPEPFDWVIGNLTLAGDAYLRRVQRHVPRSGDSSFGSLSEQFNKYSGYMQGARDLTWSHSSVLSVYYARRALKEVY